MAGGRSVVATGSVSLDSAEVDGILAEPLLLPSFDEYLLSYRDRSAVISPEGLTAVIPGRNGMFKPVVVVGGEVVGIWSRHLTSDTVTVTIEPFEELASAAHDGLARRADDYGAFLGMQAQMVIEV
ncbi:MAG: winged helix DNA-binding domain-containing protein [Microthrixaceae bacterium]|nr:winged helix DNA-binding domain-containing protein [Microthrixaceae bacterium]